MICSLRLFALLMMPVVLVFTGCGDKDAPSDSKSDNSAENADGSSDKKEDSADKESPISPEQAAENLRQAKKMKQLANAMHAYHDVYNRFPNVGVNRVRPTKIESRPGLSWRVALLPYLGEQELYDEFTPDEPWDGVNNKKLAAKMPDIFSSPDISEDGKSSMHVFYRKNRGPGPPFSIFDEDVDVMRRFGHRFRDITDGSFNTIMFVEAGPDKADHWTKPSGILFDVEQDPLESLGNISQGGFLVAFFDGYVGRIKPSIEPELFRNLIQHADGASSGFTNTNFHNIPGIVRPKRK